MYTLTVNGLIVFEAEKLIEIQRTKKYCYFDIKTKINKPKK